MKVVISAFSKDIMAAYGLADGFRALGDDVTVMPGNRLRWESYLPMRKPAARFAEISRERANKRIAAKTIGEKPDLFFAIGGEEISPGTIEAINAAGITTAAWLTDEIANIDTQDPYRWLNFSAYSHIFAVDELWAQSLQLLPTPKTYLPFACPLSKELSQEPDDHDIDVLFVGDLFSPYPNTVSGYGRRIILKNLMEEKLVSKAIVPGFSKTAFLFPEINHDASIIIDQTYAGREMSAWYRRAKIVIYINELLFKTDFDETFYRMLSDGAFVITDHKINAHKLFDGALPTAKSMDELKEKIRYCLAHEAERRATAKKITAIATARHTYRNRARHIKETLKIE